MLVSACDELTATRRTRPLELPYGPCSSLRAALTELRADGSMLNAVDKGLGNVTDALIDQGMWNSSLIILTSDNVHPHF